MPGQGRPLFGFPPPCSRTWCGIAALLLAVFSSENLLAQRPPQEPIQQTADEPPQEILAPIRLRVTWSLSQPIQLSARVQAQQATFSRPLNLCLSAGTTGALRIDSPGHLLLFAPHGMSQFGGFDVTVEGGADGLLEVSLEAASAIESTSLLTIPGEPPQGARQTVTQTLNLKELHQQAASIEIPGLGFVSVRRAPGDSIVADFDRDALVFWTTEQVPLTLRVAPLEEVQPEETLELRMTVRAARDGAVLQQHNWPVVVEKNGTLPPIDAGELKVPAEQGAYDLEILCVRPRKSALDLLTNDLRSLRGETVMAATTIEIVAVASEQAVAEAKPFRTIGQIQPLRRNWSIPRLLPQVTSILAASEEPVASGPLGEEQHAGEATAVIAPRGWYACPLPIENRGQPHILIIRYPRGQSMQLGVSVVQTNAAGKILPIGSDTGIAANKLLEPVPAAPWAEHRVVFWPHCRTPYVVLSNHDSSEPVRFESIRVEAGPATLAAIAPAALESSAVAIGAVPDAIERTPSAAAKMGRRLGTPRLAALYLDKPLLAEGFGDAGYFDEQSGMVLEDWTTFLIAAERLVDYLQWAGYNGAIVTVSSEGGALYPSAPMATTPRFDNGTFSSLGRDPLRKDVLELLMRMFDRAGLQLVPAIELATPLTDLEKRLGRPDAEPGIRPTDSHGRLLTGGTGPLGEGLVPHYNALNPDVRDAVTEVVSELTDRYGGHRSFMGVGLHLGPHTYLQLPSTEWTQDEQTLRHFAAQLDTAPADGTALVNWIQGPGAEAFSLWRASQLTSLYEGLARAAKGRKLLLLTADSAGAPTLARNHGLDWQSIGQLNNVIVLRLIRESIFRDVVQQSSDAKHNEELQWDQQLSSAKAAGGLVYRPPLETRLADFQQRGPVAAGSQRKHWYIHAVPNAQRYRHQIVRLFEHLDPQVLAIGGWTAALGQEAAAREVLQSFAQLPQEVMQPVAAAGQLATSVRLRQLVRADQTVLSAVNISPWPLAIEVDFGKPVTGRVLGGESNSSESTSSESTGSESTSSESTGGESTSGEGTLVTSGNFWRQTLQPGQLIVIELDGATPVRLWNERPAGGAEFLRRLADQVQELAARVAMLARPRLYPELRNGSFAESAAGSIPGWMHSQHPPGCVQITPQGFGDASSVRLLNDGSSNAKTWMVSVPFRASATGRLAVSLQARCDSDADAAIQPALRVGIEGRVGGEPLRRSVTLHPSGDGNWQPQPLWLEVADLGGEEIEELRLTIDLLSPGRVWIDDVQLYDFFLTQAERSSLQSQAFLAVQRMRQGDLTAAARLFDSHWGRYLMGLRVPRPKPVEAPASDETTIPPQEESPGIAQRVKGWLPSPLRF